MIQNNVDGGSNQGIFLLDKDNSDYGIYTAQSGSNKSLNDLTAIDGINFSSYAVRF